MLAGVVKVSSNQAYEAKQMSYRHFEANETLKHRKKHGKL